MNSGEKLEIFKFVEAQREQFRVHTTEKLQAIVAQHQDLLIMVLNAITVLRERRQQIPHVIFEMTLKTPHCPAAMELVLPRWVPDGTRRGRIEVFLTRREHGDPNWPELPYHTPGTYFWPQESDDETAARLALKELAPARLVRFEQVRSINLRHDYDVLASTRSVVFCGRVEGEPANGKWFDLRAVRSGAVPLIDSHHDILEIGVLPLLSDPQRFAV